MASLVKSDLQKYRCNDSFVAQQRLATRPQDGQSIPEEMVHIGMKELMETIENAIAFPPVMDTEVAFDTACGLKYQRLEWPQMLRSHGQLIMANGQKLRIQKAKSIDAKAMRQVKRAAARNKLISKSRQLDLELVDEIDRREDCTTTWAAIDKMARMVHQSDVTPASEVPADEMVVDDENTIDLDSGVSSHHTTPAPTPDVILVSSIPPMPRIPIPSARAPSPELSAMPELPPRPASMAAMFEKMKKLLDGQEELQKSMEEKMDKQGTTIAKLESMYETATADLATLKLEFRAREIQVKNYDYIIKN